MNLEERPSVLKLLEHRFITVIETPSRNLLSTFKENESSGSRTDKIEK